MEKDPDPDSERMEGCGERFFSVKDLKYFFSGF